MTINLWYCDTCPTYVFIEETPGFKGGFCQKAGDGCRGDIHQTNDANLVLRVINSLSRRGERPRPWLTFTYEEDESS